MKVLGNNIIIIIIIDFIDKLRPEAQRSECIYVCSRLLLTCDYVIVVLRMSEYYYPKRYWLGARASCHRGIFPNRTKDTT